MTSRISHLIGLWVFLVLFEVLEWHLYSHGHDTFFWRHNTVEEKELQRIAIDKARGECR